MIFLIVLASSTVKMVFFISNTVTSGRPDRACHDASRDIQFIAEPSVRLSFA